MVVLLLQQRIKLTSMAGEKNKCFVADAFFVNDEKTVPAAIYCIFGKYIL